MRKRYVMVITVVTVLALAGGAGAAAHYVISNINQIKPSVRAQLHGARGPRGFQGPRGFRGASAPGGGGLTGVTVIQSPEAFICSDGSCPSADYATATCPSGDVVISGGFLPDVNDYALPLLGDSIPIGTTAWSVVVGDQGSTNGGFFAVAECAKGTAGAVDASAGRASAFSRLAAESHQLALGLKRHSVG